MPYSPEDIVAYAFRTRARGYDRDEVDGFLDELADQIEQERARSTTLEERVTALESKLAEADESERALKRTLMTVQDAADRALVEAREEVAELRASADRDVAALRERTDQELAEQRARADAEAAEVVAAAQAEAAAQRDRVRELQELDAAHRARLRGHLEGELAALAELPDPFADLDLGDAPEGADEGEGAMAGEGTDGDVPAQEDPAERDPWRRSPSRDEFAQLAAEQALEPGGDPAERDRPGVEGPGDDDADEQRPDAPMWS